jgi:EmrB/QacA subfamily drug resistance transporter
LNNDEFCSPFRSNLQMTITDTRTRWLALIVLCLGDLMIVLDTTIVNVALPSIGSDLGFSQTSLAWVVNAYLLTFGGFLLLGGRLGDLFGPRRLFLAGITLFTLASLACGLSDTRGLLVGARAVQGLGGAVVSAVALSLIMNLFTEPVERAKAMGVFGFVSAGGGSAGVLLGGVLTDVLDWHWIFLVNIPIGAAVFASTLILLPGTRTGDEGRRLDVSGAVLVTASLMLAVYAIVNGNQEGWLSGRTVGMLVAAAALLVLFLGVEARVRSPLVPLAMLRLRSIAGSNTVGILWSAGMFAWFFLSALYLTEVLGYSSLEVGLAFLPATLIMGSLSLGLSAKIVMRYGTRRPLAIGMLLVAVGLASGIVNTAFMMGGALGLAVLASLASWRTDRLRASGDDALTALTGGYHLAFVVGALFAVAAAAVGGAVLRSRQPAGEQEEAAGVPATAEAD